MQSSPCDSLYSNFSPLVFIYQNQNQKSVQGVFFRSFCMYFHMNLHSPLVNIHCFCEFTPVCAKWKANGPPWRNKLIKKWSQQEQLKKVCVYPKQRCKYISSLFFFLYLSPFELLFFIYRAVNAQATFYFSKSRSALFCCSFSVCLLTSYQTGGIHIIAWLIRMLTRNQPQDMSHGIAMSGKMRIHK